MLVINLPHGSRKLVGFLFKCTEEVVLTINVTNCRENMSTSERCVLISGVSLERFCHLRGVLIERCPQCRGAIRGFLISGCPKRCPNFRGVLRER